MSTAVREPEVPRRHWRTTALTAAFLGIVAAVCLWAGLLFARGGHLYVVQTPSMARTAPVGTLVVAEKVDPSTLHVGDIISFQPPGVDRVYTHRIVQVTVQGFRTKGDLNQSPDGWVVPASRVVGRATHLWFGLGWLVEMLPWLALGAFITGLLGWRVKERYRAAVGIVGAALSLSLALVIVRPLVRAETIGFVPVADKGVTMSVVGTGLLPIRATSLDHHTVDVLPGQLGWVNTFQTDSHGRYQLLPALHLPWWGWVLMVLFWLSPLIGVLLIKEDKVKDGGGSDGAPPTEDQADAAAPAAAGAGALSLVGLGRLALKIGAGAVASVMLALGFSPTSAALSASVSNSSDTVASRPFFTCLDAMQHYNGGSGHNGWLYLGYTMGNSASSTSVGATDQSSYATYAGQPNSAVSQSTTNVGCVSDYNARKQYAATFNGSSSQWDVAVGSSISNATSNPGNANNMTWNTWVRTTSTTGGVVSCPGGTDDSCADRTTWMDNAGHFCFGVSSSYICSPKTYNDGTWHMVTSQISTSTGMTLWVDGAVVATNTSVTGGYGIISYPQWGFSSATLDSGWKANWPTNLYFTGDMQMGAMFGANSAGVQLQTYDVLAIYQSAMP